MIKDALRNTPERRTQRRDSRDRRPGYEGQRSKQRSDRNADNQRDDRRSLSPDPERSNSLDRETRRNRSPSYDRARSGSGPSARSRSRSKVCDDSDERERGRLPESLYSGKKNIFFLNTILYLRLRRNT